MNFPFFHELKFAAEIAQIAGSQISSLSGQSLTVEHKDAHQVVTIADKKADELIVNALKHEFKTDKIVSEESVEKDQPGSGDPGFRHLGEVSSPERIWFVDPLDGTREFISGGSDYCVMIGLVVDHRPKLGVVHIPTTCQTYIGLVGYGAWKYINGELQPIPAIAERSYEKTGKILISSRLHPHPLVEKVWKTGAFTDWKRRGSVGIKAVEIIEGRADVYLEPATQTSSWDSCAPEALMLALGGACSDLEKNNLSYQRGHVRNLAGIAFARNQDLLFSSLQVLKQAKGA